ncbi:methylenetetrahydrofolate reductase [soil metagenome]
MLAHPADAAGPADVPAILTGLMDGFSVEVTPREAGKLPPLTEFVRPGTRVYITYLTNTAFEDTVATSAKAVAEGMRPVPHLAARAVPDRATLDRIVGALADVGVRDALVIAGSLRAPVGPYAETMQLLDSGVLQEHGFDSIGVAGHPEGNKDIGEPELARALADKNALAARQGLALYLVTQFSFAPEPIVAWERRIRAAGNRLPIVVGLPGLTSPAKLLKFGLSCGVGASLKVLRKQSGGVLKLASSAVYHPDQTLLGLARAVHADPDTLIAGMHFYPFGALAATAAYAEGLRAGRFTVEDGDRLDVTA